MRHLRWSTQKCKPPEAGEGREVPGRGQVSMPSLVGPGSRLEGTFMRYGMHSCVGSDPKLGIAQSKNSDWITELNWEGHCSLLTYTLSFHYGNAPIFSPFLESHPCVLEMRREVQKGSMFAPQPHPEHVPNSLTESQNFYMIRADGCSDSHSRGDVSLVTCWWGKHENSGFKISVKQKRNSLIWSKSALSLLSIFLLFGGH